MSLSLGYRLATRVKEKQNNKIEACDKKQSANCQFHEVTLTPRAFVIPEVEFLDVIGTKVLKVPKCEIFDPFFYTNKSYMGR